MLRMTALVGENGCRQVNIDQIVASIYDVQSGSIKIRGDDLKEIDPKDLRSRIGVLFQDYAT